MAGAEAGAEALNERAPGHVTEGLHRRTPDT
jgi:hypothetical protein